MGFPIDVVYLDRKFNVIRIESELRPWRLAPVAVQAESVLELPPRTALTTGTSVGDRIEITLDSQAVGAAHSSSAGGRNQPL